MTWHDKGSSLMLRDEETDEKCALGACMASAPGIGETWDIGVQIKPHVSWREEGTPQLSFCENAARWGRGVATDVRRNKKEAVRVGHSCVNVQWSLVCEVVG